MTLRRTEIIEWSTTPRELRRIADAIEYFILQERENNLSGHDAPFIPMDTISVEREGEIVLQIRFDQGQWQAEQVEDKE